MILYIMGRPHSGSTILDIALGNSAQINSVGQLISDMGKLDNHCSCGETLARCPFWSRVRAIVEKRGIAWDDAVTRTVGQGHIGRFPGTFFASSNDAAMQDLARINAVIGEAIAEVAEKPIVCDSSKEPTRGMFLVRYLDKVRVVHLVRDPRSAVASHYWRYKDRGFYHFLRKDRRSPYLGPVFMTVAAVSWLVGNLACELVRWRGGDRVLQVRYEDFRDKPVEVLERIGRFVGADMKVLVEKVEAGAVLDVEHVMGGNDVRLEQQIRLEASRSKPRRKLPAWLTGLIVVLCWPLMLRYRYPLS